MKSEHLIPIDFEIYKYLQAKRVSFDETLSDVLRRQLGLKERSSPPPTDTDKNPQFSACSAASLRSWVGDGVVLPENTELFMRYRGIPDIKGKIQGGGWVIGKHKFDSPSGAAGALVGMFRGGTWNINGWRTWKVKRPGDSDFVLLDLLRRQNNLA